MFLDIILSDDRRGISEIAHTQSPHIFIDVARRLTDVCSPILLLTGFFIPSAQAPETDGPIGAAALANALKKLGKQIAFFTDPHTVAVLHSICPDDPIHSFPVMDPEPSASLARRILKDLAPSAVIAIERPGPNADGRFFTMRNVDISSWTAHLEFLFNAPVTIGIGDGGNELGLGGIATRLPVNFPSTVTESSHMLIGGTSNDAAFALIAALEILTDRDDLLPTPSEVTDWLTCIVHAGAVDGILGTSTLSVDGYSMTETTEVLKKLKARTHIYKPVFRELKRLQIELQTRYGVAIFDVLPSIDPQSKCLTLTGYALLERHHQTLLDRLKPLHTPIQSLINILEHPSDASPEPLVRSNRPVIPLLDRPLGKLTSEILPADYPLRLLHRIDGWLAVQLPDLSIGWIEHRHVTLFEGFRASPSSSWSASRALPNQTPHLNCSISAFIESAADWISTPYKLGGRTDKGIDCSALMQRLFTHHGLLLPRHTADQFKMGVRIPIPAMESGDLVFALNSTRAIRHVALCLSDEVIHACLSERAVVRQSIAQFKERYRITGVRRIALFKDAKE